MSCKDECRDFIVECVKLEISAALNKQEKEQIEKRLERAKLAIVYILGACAGFFIAVLIPRIMS